MPLINCEITLNQDWLAIGVIRKDNIATTFAIADIKLYVTVATLSTQNTARLPQQ